MTGSRGVIILPGIKTFRFPNLNSFGSKWDGAPDYDMISNFWLKLQAGYNLIGCALYSPLLVNVYSDNSDLLVNDYLNHSDRPLPRKL